MAETIASLFGESVAIFDGDGLWPLERVVRSMPATNRAPSSPLKVAPGRWEHWRSRKRTMTSDATMRRAIATIVSPVAALYIDGGARMGMMHHLSMGPADGVHVNTFEAQEAHAMLEALGFAGSCIYMPFAFRFRSVVEGINHVSTMVERFEERSGCAVSCMLEGDLMVGWCSTTDSSDGAAAFGRIAWMRLPYWKATVYTWCMAEWHWTR